jgi:hypothetical protein
MIATLVTAATMLLVAQASSKPAALVLDRTGPVEIRPVQGPPQRAEIGDLLYPGERLAVPTDGAATLAILGVGAQERLQPGTEATVGPRGCTPMESVAARTGQKPAVARTMKGVRPASPDSRKAGLTLRAGPAPAVTPIDGATIVTDRPTLAWPPAEGARVYFVHLRTFAGRELWQARTTESHLAYPEGKDPLPLGSLCRWEVSYQDRHDRDRPLVQAEFAVASPTELGQMEELQSLAASEDRAVLLTTALAYQRLGAFAAATAVFERLARLAPEEPAYQAALAELYTRAGRAGEAQVASDRAGRKAKTGDPP